MSFDGDGRLTRRGLVIWGALAALFAAIVTVPQAYLVDIGTLTWPVAAAVSAAFGVAYACMYVHMYKSRSRMRRFEHVVGHIISLCESLPRKSEVETLAVLHEIRTCYAKACGLAGDLGIRDGQTADTMRATRAKLDRLYDVQTGSLRRTEANAAEFAEAMRGLGREVDGTERKAEDAGTGR